ncbi:MAG: hypoxanthine phosphoribosyltransferase, partial [Duncaniella sp.]|nr:hypoxanthine phosphoribosyltransferase [Duncaniella sp.]
MKQKCYKGLNFIPYIGSDRIQARVRELGGQITARYEGRNPLLICVLNGAAPFALDLFRAIDTDAEISFVRLSSYEGMESSGKVKQLLGLTEQIEGRDVIVVEDIIDTGRTMHKLLGAIGAMKPASLALATQL